MAVKLESDRRNNQTITVLTDFPMVLPNDEMISTTSIRQGWLAKKLKKGDITLAGATLLLALNKVTGVDSIFIHKYDIDIYLGGITMPKDVMPVIQQIVELLEPEIREAHLPL